eukprot:364750-Chlamydomonas_euryale.AAC.19
MRCTARRRAPSTGPTFWPSRFEVWAARGGEGRRWSAKRGHSRGLGQGWTQGRCEQGLLLGEAGLLPPPSLRSAATLSNALPPIALRCLPCRPSVSQRTAAAVLSAAPPPPHPTFRCAQNGGLDVYTEQCTKERFLDLSLLLPEPVRSWASSSVDSDGGDALPDRPAMDLDYLIHTVMERDNPIDWHAVLESPVDLKVQRRGPHVVCLCGSVEVCGSVQGEQKLAVLELLVDLKVRCRGSRRGEKVSGGRAARQPRGAALRCLGPFCAYVCGFHATEVWEWRQGGRADGVRAVCGPTGEAGPFYSAYPAPASLRPSARSRLPASVWQSRL